MTFGAGLPTCRTRHLCGVTKPDIFNRPVKPMVLSRCRPDDFAGAAAARHHITRDTYAISSTRPKTLQPNRSRTSPSQLAAAASGRAAPSGRS